MRLSSLVLSLLCTCILASALAVSWAWLEQAGIFNPWIRIAPFLEIKTLVVTTPGMVYVRTSGGSSYDCTATCTLLPDAPPRATAAPCPQDTWVVQARLPALPVTCFHSHTTTDWGGITQLTALDGDGRVWQWRVVQYRDDRSIVVAAGVGGSFGLGVGIICAVLWRIGRLRSRWQGLLQSMLSLLVVVGVVQRMYDMPRCSGAIETSYERVLFIQHAAPACTFSTADSLDRLVNHYWQQRPPRGAEQTIEQPYSNIVIVRYQWPGVSGLHGNRQALALVDYGPLRYVFGEGAMPCFPPTLADVILQLTAYCL
jgi:hypothetical protein